MFAATDEVRQFKCIVYYRVQVVLHELYRASKKTENRSRRQTADGELKTQACIRSSVRRTPHSGQPQSLSTCDITYRFQLRDILNGPVSIYYKVIYPHGVLYSLRLQGGVKNRKKKWKQKEFILKLVRNRGCSISQFRDCRVLVLSTVDAYGVDNNFLRLRCSTS